MMQEIQEIFEYYMSHLAPAAGIIKPVNTDTEGTIQSVCINRVHIKRIEFRENVRAFFPQGESKLSKINEMSILSGCP